MCTTAVLCNVTEVICLELPTHRTTVPSTSCSSTGAVTVMATYTTGQGQSQAAVATLKLPAGLFVDLVPPIKEAAYKIVLDTNRPPPQLTLLFDDLVAQSTSLASTAAANVLSVRFVSGQEATIIVSRTGGRYRVQSDHFHPMWLFADELCTRLRALFAGQGGADKGEEPFKIQFLEPLPLGDLFEVMDSHLEVTRGAWGPAWLCCWSLRCRRRQSEESSCGTMPGASDGESGTAVLMEEHRTAHGRAGEANASLLRVPQARLSLTALMEELEKRATQFRSIQKRLLVRFKDRNPEPLKHLDELLNSTHR